MIQRRTTRRAAMLAGTPLRKSVRNALHVSGLIASGIACFHADPARAGPYPARMQLSALDADTGLVMQGVDLHDYAGWAVAGVGDVNGDGFDDIAIGAPGLFLYPTAGQAYVVFGTVDFAASGPLDLSTLDGSNGFVVRGAPFGGRLGTGVDGAGDVNGDGFGDMIVGSPLEGTGFAYVIFGGAEVGATGAVDVSLLDGSDGFVMRGLNDLDYTGYAVSEAGDFNGDGIDDLVVGAPLFNGFDGRAYVVFGSPTIGRTGRLALSSLRGSNGFTIESDVQLAIAEAVSGAVDVNADGFSDLIVGTGFGDRSWVVFGGPTTGSEGTLDLAGLDGTEGFVVLGTPGIIRFGISVAGLPDVNGDGYDDFIIGSSTEAPTGLSLQGACYVLFGDASVGAGGSIDVASLDGESGFVLTGVHEQDYAGTAVAAGGDVDGDGMQDILIGAPGVDVETSSVGESYVLFGATELGATGRLELAELNGDDGFVLVGFVTDSNAGAAVGAADVNGDGRSDVIVGAPGTLEVGATQGEAYVVTGPPDLDDDGIFDGEDNCVLVPNADQRDSNGDGFGNVCDADLNGDLVVNFSDLALLKVAFFSSNADADLDGSGSVNFADLGIMKGGFFAPPGPSGLAD